MEQLWQFLYTTLDIFPFLPLLYYAAARNIKKKRIVAAMLFSAGIMLIQGILSVWFFSKNGSDMQWQLTFRELCAMSYLIPLIFVARIPWRKVLFVFCVFVPISLFTISISYLPSYLSASDALFTHPCMEEVLLRLVLILAVYPLLYLLIRKILRPALNIDSQQIWTLIWMIPLFLAALSLLFTHHYFQTDYYFLFVILRSFTSICCLVSCSLLLQSLQAMADYTEARTESEQSKRLLSIQEEQYRIVTKNIAQTRAMRHDLRHQLFMIRTLTKDEKYDQLQKFVDACTADTSTNVELTVCDNYIVNSITTHYFAIARENGVEVSFAIAPLSDSLPISDTDLCILIGNSMENAIEACKKLPTGNRSIRFNMKILAGNLSMTIDNTYDGKLIKKGERFISTKRDGQQEGIGIRSIRSIAEKHGGSIRIEHNERMFMLSVMIPLR